LNGKEINCQDECAFGGLFGYKLLVLKIIYTFCFKWILCALQHKPRYWRPKFTIIHINQYVASYPNFLLQLANCEWVLS